MTVQQLTVLKPVLAARAHIQALPQVRRKTECAALVPRRAVPGPRGGCTPVCWCPGEAALCSWVHALLEEGGGGLWSRGGVAGA